MFDQNETNNNYDYRIILEVNLGPLYHVFTLTNVTRRMDTSHGWIVLVVLASLLFSTYNSSFQHWLTRPTTVAVLLTNC